MKKILFFTILQVSCLVGNPTRDFSLPEETSRPLPPALEKILRPHNRLEDAGYGTHMTTGIAAYAGAAVLVLAGSYVGGQLATAHIPARVGKVLGLAFHDGPYDSREPLGVADYALLVTPVLAAVAAGGTLMYKMPQLTDTYILGKDTQRTTKQNVITFLNRICLGIPRFIYEGLTKTV